MTLRDRRLLFADPALKTLRPRLAAILKAGKIAPPPSGYRYLVIGAEQLDASGRLPAKDRTLPLVVVEGPTPLDGRRLPASLVLLCPHGEAEDSLKALAVALVQKAAQDTTSPAFDFTNFWRTRQLDCAATGETAAQGAAGLGLEHIMTGQDRQPAHPVWAAMIDACSELDVSPERVMNHLLSRETAWFSPYTGELIPAEEAAGIIGIMQDHWEENALPAHCFGAQYWNHPSIGATFSGAGGAVSFHETWPETLAAAKAGKGRILSWAGRTEAAFETECAENGVPLVRIEDGFLRSVGLGAGLARGAMLAADDLGIYYDPSRPSRLEVLLQTCDLTGEELRRGRDLVDLVRVARVSKYNFGKARAFDFPSGRTRILVPGQVADDAAIRKSRSETIDCRNTPNVNIDLLRLARERNPDAFLVFKPHPDVETGLRKGRVPREQALEYADAIAGDANIIDLIEAVDALETFSSLSGFEALFRGKKVAVHGAPFYAGWGLCEDLTRIEGRTRRRSLPELVYLALVKYARTIDPVSLLPCTPEFLVTRLTEQRSDRKHLIVTAAKRHASWLGRKLGL